MKVVTNSLIRLIIQIGAMWIAGSFILVLGYGVYNMFLPVFMGEASVFMQQVVLAPLAVGAVIYVFLSFYDKRA